MDLQIEITHLAFSDLENKVKISVTVSGSGGQEKKSFSVFSDFPICRCLKTGSITPEFFDEIERMSDLTRAICRGLLILGYGECSKKALTLKLRKKGFARDIAAEAVEYISDMGYINESDAAVREAERQIKQLRGRNRIYSCLREKGFDNESIAAADEYLESVNFEALCIEAIQKKCHDLPEDRNDLEKLCAYLFRMGYSSAEIKGAIRLLK